MDIRALAEYMLYRMQIQNSLGSQDTSIDGLDSQNSNMTGLLPTADFAALLEESLGPTADSLDTAMISNNQAMQVPMFDPSSPTSVDDPSITNIFQQSNTSQTIPQSVKTMIDRTAARYDVNPELISSVIQQESGYNQAAVSSVGAQGLMQLMPATAASLGVTNAFDPAANIDGGTRYLRNLLQQFHGDTSLALAAYNAGPSTLSRLGIETGQDLSNKFSRLPMETQRYVQDIEANINAFDKK